MTAPMCPGCGADIRSFEPHGRFCSRNDPPASQPLSGDADLGPCPTCGNVRGTLSSTLEAPMDNSELIAFLQTRDAHADEVIEANNKRLSELAVQCETQAEEIEQLKARVEDSALHVSLGSAQEWQPITGHWSVSVERSGENVVTIEPGCLSGRNISAEDAAVIETAARSLLSFLGLPAPPASSARSPEEKP